MFIMVLSSDNTMLHLRVKSTDIRAQGKSTNTTLQRTLSDSNGYALMTNAQCRGGGGAYMCR